MENQTEELPVFDFDAFRKTKYEPRELTLEVKSFGDTGKSIIWHYTGLDSIGYGKVEEAENEYKRAEKITEAAIKMSGGDPTEMLSAFGYGQKIPATTLKRYVIFELGSREPTKPKSRKDTVDFANAFPADFVKITDAIWAATCMGKSIKKKQNGSGITAQSAPTSASEG